MGATVQNIANALISKHPEAILEEVRRNPIISIKENYDDLLFPADNEGRSSMYTRYVSKTDLLRTHTSAAIPEWLKVAATNGLSDTIITLPGICYRRDVIDKIHCGEPHQMDIWRIRKDVPRLVRKDLIDLIETILDSTIPGYEYRANEVTHPYTLRGLEVEVMVDGNWLELLECGKAHPVVLKNAGLDPSEYSGLALGMGLDRLVMIIKKINDLL